MPRLDIARRPAQKQLKVSRISPGLYAQWRARSWAAQALAERPDGSPLTERLLQLIWQHQRLQRDQLQTIDGRAVRVLHPGFWNHEAGPDFRSAVIQFGDALACNGDIEVDLAPQAWHGHRHDQNAAYKHVILHVVWDAGPGSVPTTLPTLALKAQLDAPLEELGLWLRTEPHAFPTDLAGKCSTALTELCKAQRTAFLHEAAATRLETKGSQLQARARQVGWDQALWEGLFGALGYKHNIWPMRRIAEVLPMLTTGASVPLERLVLQARLLGVSGLLPTDLSQVRPGAQEYLRQLWNLWWRDQEQFADLALPSSLWRLFGLRPANHPQRRLALVAHWLCDPGLIGRLEGWFAAARPDAHLPSSLLTVLHVKEDEFWSYHWSFRSARIASPQPLLGPQRLTDLAINVILPWFWIRAVLGQNCLFQERAQACYFAWPKAEDNTVLRLARRRIFGSASEAITETAALQQGMLQIVRDFCDYSNALCTNCLFPGLVKEWGQ